MKEIVIVILVPYIVDFYLKIIKNGDKFVISQLEYVYRDNSKVE